MEFKYGTDIPCHIPAGTPEPAAGEVRRLLTAGNDIAGRVIQSPLVWIFYSEFWLLFIHLGMIASELFLPEMQQKGRVKHREKEEYNFEDAEQGAVVNLSPGKTRITIRLDTDILNWFRQQVEKNGGGNYQTLVNEALREYIDSIEGKLEKTVRKVIREELKIFAKGA